MPILQTFNSKLLALILAIVLVVSTRLFFAALATGNWRGFGFSLVHILIVAIGTYYAVRQRSAEKPFD